MGASRHDERRWGMGNDLGMVPANVGNCQKKLPMVRLIFWEKERFGEFGNRSGTSRNL
ncbi:hypothetical protein M413DRAFT_448626 [Hebeloma cylindrosporum]|uniref:Uncharacterized protein n=1 Tax=Hebeloma cylindrosporum TaxID=76867 RepID=A0A0C2XHK3_HEBCY|nr:hypothetical protein M413DRAFT_448626 [Hebeloma cylindrosporum h7]